MLKANFLCCLEDEKGKQIIGPGLYELLAEVEKTGSLSQAAREMNMSYRTAWGRIKKIEARLGAEVIEKQIGGTRGGGSRLTARGSELMKVYRSLMANLNETRLEFLTKNNKID